MMTQKSTSGGALSGATHLTFVFPLPVNLANARMHWRTKLEAKKRFYAECDAKQASSLLPVPPSAPWTHCIAKAVMYLGAEMDDDNSAHRLKWCWDWLKTRGYIVDDKRKHLTRVGYPEQRIKRGQQYRVEVTLTRLTVMEKQSA
jgi:hypothetical protein